MCVVTVQRPVHGVSVSEILTGSGAVSVSEILTGLELFQFQFQKFGQEENKLFGVA